MKQLRLECLCTISLILLLVIALFSGCGPDETEDQDPTLGEEKPRSGGVLRLAIGGDPESLDPHMVADWNSRQGVAYMFDRLILVAADPDTGEEKIEPDLAKDWEVSEDGLTWTFYLREDVTFHDGTDFDAEAVKFNFERAMDEDFNSTFLPTFEPRVKDIEVVDQYTVKIHMKRADIRWLDTHISQFYFLSPTAVEEMGEEGIARNPVGTGPFKFESFASDSHVKMERFDDYWKGTPPIEGLEVRIIPEDSTQHLEFEAGELDIIHHYAISPGDVEEIEDAGGILEGREVPGQQMLAMNLADGPTADLEVRKAISHAIDRGGIIETILEGAATKSVVGLPPAAPLFNEDLPMIEYDPELSAQLLEDAGWQLNDDGIRYKNGEPLELELLTSDREDRVLITQVLHEQLEAVGFKCEMVTVEWGTYLDACRAGDYHVTYWILNQDAWATNPAHSNIRSDSHWQIFQIDEQPELSDVSSRIDDLLDSFEGEMDPDARESIIRDFQEIMRENMLIFFLWNETNFNAVQSWVKDYYLYNYNLFYLHDAWIDDAAR